MGEKGETRRGERPQSPSAERSDASLESRAAPRDPSFSQRSASLRISWGGLDCQTRSKSHRANLGSALQSRPRELSLAQVGMGQTTATCAPAKS